ncbi:sulfate ABC transporter substrate-binding protein, partial [Streptomyces sp. NPDC089919]
DKAKASANAALKTLSGKELPAKVIDPAWASIRTTDDPLATTLKTEADWAVKAQLIKQPDLTGIYDLTLLNKVLKAAGKPEVTDAGLGAK